MYECADRAVAGNLGGRGSEGTHWRMSERSGCGEYLMRIFICVWQKKNTFMCFCFVLI